jgi:hypothetical protein
MLRLVLWIGSLTIVGVVVSLLMFGVGAYDFYAYRVGTPTAATIEQCTQVPGGSDQTCTATWSVGGKSHTGAIASGGHGYPQGSSQDVHVHGGTAYTADAASTNLWAGTGVVVLAVLLIALAALLVWGGGRARQDVSSSYQHPDAAPAAPQRQNKRIRAGRRIAGICLWIVAGFVVAGVGPDHPGWAYTVVAWLFSGCWMVALYLGISWVWHAFRQRRAHAATNSPPRAG